MRFLKYILPLLLAFSEASAQIPIGNPNPNTDYSSSNFVRARRSLIRDLSDTSFIARFAGTEVLFLRAGVDTTVWRFNGTRFLQVEYPYSVTKNFIINAYRTEGVDSLFFTRLDGTVVALKDSVGSVGGGSGVDSITARLGTGVNSDTLVYWKSGTATEWYTVNKFDSTHIYYYVDTTRTRLDLRIDTIPKVVSYFKNSTNDSTILLLNDGRRFAALDRVNDTISLSNRINAKLTGTVNNGRILFSANGTAKDTANLVYNRANGNVGIGLSNPSSYYAKNLVINTPDDGGLTLAATSTSATSLFAFADGTTGNQAFRGYISYRHLTDAFGFGTAGTERFRITSNGQVGINNLSPANSAVLDISSSSQGVLIPRMTQTNRDAIVTPDTGLQIYNTTSNRINMRDASVWQSLAFQSDTSFANSLIQSVVRVGDSVIVTTKAGNINKFSVGGGGGSIDYVASGLGIRVDSSGRVYTVNSDTTSAVVLSRQRAANTYFSGSINDSRLLFSAGGQIKDTSALVYNRANRSVGIGTATPNASSLLDLTSDDKGLLIPRMTETLRNAIVSPATGLQVYNTTTNRVNVWDGTIWREVGSGAVSGGLYSIQYNRNGLFSGNANFVYDTVNQRVGIGISNPSNQLDIITNANTSFRNIRAGNLSSGSTAIAGIELHNNTGLMGSLSTYSSGFNISSLRNNIGWVATNNLVIMSNGQNVSGGTSNYIEYRPGGFNDSQSRLRQYEAGQVISTSQITQPPNASSVLELLSTTKGFLPPRMTTAQRTAIPSPAEGLIVYDITVRKLYVFTTTWEMITSL